jgi:hypothetical protein
MFAISIGNLLIYINTFVRCKDDRAFTRRGVGGIEGGFTAFIPPKLLVLHGFYIHVKAVQRRLYNVIQV